MCGRRKLKNFLVTLLQHLIYLTVATIYSSLSLALVHRFTDSEGAPKTFLSFLPPYRKPPVG